MRSILLIYIVLLIAPSCLASKSDDRVRIIFDTDANNELDDQHALAYLLFNEQTFNLIGVTVNATHGGGSIDRHYEEAYRVLRLCGAAHRIPLLKGADADFVSISPMTEGGSYDGKEAVDFMVNNARQATKDSKLTIVAVGKLTNIALALEKEPGVAELIKVVWLGGNYPKDGEYNLKADTAALNAVLKSTVEFEMVSVRYGMESGSDAVRIKQATIQAEMAGKGPVLPFDIVGRHGGEFRTFGDYSVSLFEHINYRDQDRTRALFDVVPLAIVKNPDWGKRRLIKRVLYVDGRWVKQSKDNRYITLWEHFDREAIVGDFLSSFQHSEERMSGTSNADQIAEYFLVDRWNFEKKDDPLANSGYLLSDTIRMIQKNGEVYFSNGLADIDIGEKQPGVLRGKSTVLTRNEYTIWMRMRISDNSAVLAEKADSSWFFSAGNIKLSFHRAKGEKRRAAYGVKAVIKENEHWMEMSPKANVNIDFGTWIQLALTKKRESGLDRYRLYYRPESTKRTLINWIYLGSLHAPITVDTDQWKLGQLSDHSSSTDRILVDELRCYEKRLSESDLLDIWPSLDGFVNYPKQPYGTVIDHCPAKTGRYIAGSPSIVIMEDGSYLAKGDDYGPAVGVSELARVYRSVDRGATWQQISEVEGITWATLFTHHGSVYMMGTSAGHGLGHTIIIKSNDGGMTWTKPIDSDNGLIFSDLSYHTAPVPVIIHDGRVWRSMEDEKGAGRWGENFRAFMLSAPVDADLMKASSWTASEPLGYHAEWLNHKFNGWLEGNAVTTPHGNIANVLRVSMTQGGGKAAVISYDKNGKKPSFDPKRDFIDFPGGSTKFHIQYDTLSNRYWALTNAVLEKHNSDQESEGMIRNTLVLMTSTNLYDWKIQDTVLYHPDVAKHGFQYPSFVFDGNDIVFVSRTAYEDGEGGAFRQHDVNYFTFHRIRDFRKFMRLSKLYASYWRR